MSTIKITKLTVIEISPKFTWITELPKCFEAIAGAIASKISAVWHQKMAFYGP
jgi:hypothetical protein